MTVDFAGDRDRLALSVGTCSWLDSGQFWCRVPVAPTRQKSSNNRGIMARNSQSPFSLRQAVAGDVPALRRIYSRAVSAVAPRAYTPEQFAAWRAFADAPQFDDFVLSVNTYVAERGDELLAFCGVSDAGHVASIYVDPDHSGRGLGRMMLEQVLELRPTPASGRYYAEASRFSVGLFTRCGFREIERDHVMRGGVEFERILVERRA